MGALSPAAVHDAPYIQTLSSTAEWESEGEDHVNGEAVDVGGGCRRVLAAACLCGADGRLIGHAASEKGLTPASQ